MIYSVIATGSETAAGDMLEALAPADAVLVIHELTITQSTEAGDAESEQLTVTLSRVTGAPTSGSGGTTITPRPMQAGAAAAGGTYEGFNTTDLTGGTAVDLHTESFNVHNGMVKVWTPETRPVISPSTRALLTLDGAPTDSVTFQVTMLVEELGG